MMRRNCNLELRLVTPDVSFDSADNYDNNDQYHHHPMLNLLSPKKEKQQKQQQEQQLTIFYQGNTTVCDVTELQAKAIIMLANCEMKERSKTSTTISSSTSPIINSQNGLSMKRSLQRFLQKRKNRVQENSPYHRY